MMKVMLMFAAGAMLAVALHGAPVCAGTTEAAAARAPQQAIEHGEFLVNYGGCNDCHTPGWDENGGQASTDVLLTGAGLNFQGPWGTTFPPNLRLYMQELSLAEWIHEARTMRTRPAMAWWVFRFLTDEDLADMYTYIRALGPAGGPAHAWVPPGEEAPAPYLKLITPTIEDGDVAAQ